MKFSPLKIFGAILFPVILALTVLLAFWNTKIQTKAAIVIQNSIARADGAQTITATPLNETIARNIPQGAIARFPQGVEGTVIEKDAERFVIKMEDPIAVENETPITVSIRFSRNTDRLATRGIIALIGFLAGMMTLCCAIAKKEDAYLLTIAGLGSGVALLAAGGIDCALHITEPFYRFIALTALVLLPIAYFIAVFRKELKALFSRKGKEIIKDCFRDVKTRFLVFFNNNNIECYLFFGFFCLYLTLIVLRPSGVTITALHEQWINISNSMLVHTRDFIFSYGPLMWLIEHSHALPTVPSYLLAKVFCAAVSALTMALAFGLAIRKKSFFSFIGAGTLVTFKFLPYFGSIMLIPLLHMYRIELMEDDPKPVSPAFVFVMGLFIAILFYIRFFIGVVASVSFGLYFILRFFKQRSERLTLVLLLAGVFGYIIAGLAIFNDPANLIEYARTNLILSSANAIEMILTVTRFYKYLAVFLLASIFLIVFLFKSKRILIAPLLFVLWTLLKIIFGRSDHYWMFIALVAFLFLPLVCYTGKKRYPKIAFWIICILAFAVDAPENQLALNGIRAARTPYQRKNEQAYAPFILPQEAKDLIGSNSVDAYPNRNEHIIANNFVYHFRPHFQNYMTLTPELDRMNVDFIKNDPPSFYLWNQAGMGDVDGRYLFNSDPLTLDMVLANYSPVMIIERSPVDPTIIFKRNADIAHVRYDALAQGVGTIGEWIDVPKHTNGVLKLRANLKFSTYGSLKNTLFRGSYVFVEYLFENGETRQFRLNIQNAASGLWVAPFLNDILFEGGVARKVRIVSPSRNYLKNTFDYEWVIAPIKPPNKNSVSIKNIRPGGQ